MLCSKEKSFVMKDVCVGPLVPPWFLWSEKKELTHQIVLDILTNSSSKTDLLCTWISIQNIKFRLFSLTIIDLTYESKPNFSQLWNEDQNLLGYTVCYGTHCNFYEFAKRFFGYLGLELRTYKVFLWLYHHAFIKG